jgi:hypothetical protein
MQGEAVIRKNTVACINFVGVKVAINTEEDSSLSRSWKPLIKTLKEHEKVFSQEKCLIPS